MVTMPQPWRQSSMTYANGCRNQSHLFGLLLLLLHRIVVAVALSSSIPLIDACCGGGGAAAAAAACRVVSCRVGNFW